MFTIFLTLKSQILKVFLSFVYNKEIIIQMVYNELTIFGYICQILLLLSHLKLVCRTLMSGLGNSRYLLYMDILF